MPTHKHQTILRGAAEELKRTGVIRTYDAVYRWVCPDCGHPDRTTRLADTIYTLRHAYGWKIATHAETDMLAVYTLVKVGDMPGDPALGPHPRVLVGSTPSVEATKPTGYTPYDGKPVPVEAIPSPKRWRCLRCKRETTQVLGDSMLGGYRLVQCECVAVLKSVTTTIYEPVL